MMRTVLYKQLLREESGPQPQGLLILESGLASSEFSKEASSQIICIKCPIYKTVGQIRLRAR